MKYAIRMSFCDGNHMSYDNWDRFYCEDGTLSEDGRIQFFDNTDTLPPDIVYLFKKESLGIMEHCWNNNIRRLDNFHSSHIGWVEVEVTDEEYCYFDIVNSVDGIADDELDTVDGRDPFTGKFVKVVC